MNTIKFPIKQFVPLTKYNRKYKTYTFNIKKNCLEKI